jgi:hypothetical protein
MFILGTPVLIVANSLFLTGPWTLKKPPHLNNGYEDYGTAQVKATRLRISVSVSEDRTGAIGR